LPGRYGKLQQQYSEAFTSVQDQKQLIAQLEEDLRSVNAWSAMFRGTAEVSGLALSYDFRHAALYTTAFLVY